MRQKPHFPLSGEAMYLLEPSSGYPSFEDAEVLFGINIERLFVDGIISVGLGLKNICWEKVWEGIMLLVDI